MADEKKYPHPEKLAQIPGYGGIVERLVAEGRPTRWLDEIVDVEDKYSLFIKAGKPWYLSACPHYEGYWLHGSTGSVQCKIVEGVLPGIVHDLICKSNIDACIFCDKVCSYDEE